MSGKWWTSLLSVLVVAVTPSLSHAKPANVPAHKASVAATHAAGKPQIAAINKALPAMANKAPPGAANRAPPGAANRAPPAAATKRKAKPCYAKPVQLLRVRGTVLEPREVSLTMCSGAPNPSALDSISVLGRPRDAERPPLEEIRSYRALPLPKGKPVKGRRYQNPAFVSEHVMRLHPGLLVRLQKIAKHYPGRTIEIISGFRPDARDTSRHHHGFALDLRVAGVRREHLRDYLRTFDDTGVGYYPNSFFVHMDVREGKGFWVDRSGPGEPADYGPWPIGNKKIRVVKRDGTPARTPIFKGAVADLDALREPLAKFANSHAPLHGRALEQKATVEERAPEPDHEGDRVSVDEVRRAREEARRALEEL